jgi:tetratricopeptide (TPR) repeat protein
MTDYDDDSLVENRSALAILGKFRSSIDLKGDVVQHRREFLIAMLGTASLAVTENLVSAASAEATTIETNANVRGALGDIETQLFRIGREHMQPGVNPSELMVDSLSAWRDASALRNMHLDSPTLSGKAYKLEATAAGLVAQFLGDRGELADAEHWYRAALKHAPDDDTRSWLYACRTWLYLYSGDASGAKRNASRAAALAAYFSRDRGAFGYHQLARAYALDGQNDRAREHLSNATSQFLFSSGTGNPHADPNLLRWTLLQNSQYTMDTVAILAFAEGRKSDISRFSTTAELVLGRVDSINGMNAFLARMADARIKASGSDADADAAVEATMNAVSNLRLVDRQTAVVQGRSQQFADDLEARFGDTQSVRGLRGFVTELAEAA